MYKRKSTGARLLALLIGISPLPGSPPAAYGSIIMPEAFHRRIRSNRIFRKGIRIARLLVFLFALRDRRVLAYLSPAGLSAPLRNVPVECLLSCQCAVELLSSHHPLRNFFQNNKKNFKIFQKNFFKAPFQHFLQQKKTSRNSFSMSFKCKYLVFYIISSVSCPYEKIL